MSPLSALVTIAAAFLAVLVVGPVVNWWHVRHERDFDRKYPANPKD